MSSPCKSCSKVHGFLDCETYATWVRDKFNYEGFWSVECPICMIKTGFQCPINSRFSCIECNNHFCSICIKRLNSKTRKNTVKSEISEEPTHSCEETEFTQKRKIIRNLSTRFFSYYKAWENIDKEMFELNSDMAVIQSLPETVGFFPVEIKNLNSYLYLVTQALDLLKCSYIYAYYHQRLQGEKDLNKLQYDIEKCSMTVVDLVRSLSAVDMKAEEVKQLWILLEKKCQALKDAASTLIDLLRGNGGKGLSKGALT